MKTSNKILIVTLALLIGCLGFYDMGLKAKYETGDYTNPYSNYEKLSYRNFDVVELNSSTAINIMLVQGPFKVLASSRVTDYLDIRQEKNRLIIGAKFPNQYRGEADQYIVYISCPRLSTLKADASYMAGDVKVTDTLARDLNWRPTVINGFTADSLNIEEDHAGNVLLLNNKIGQLHATVGLSNRSGSALTIGQNNQFAGTEINVLNRSRLWIRANSTNNINYHLADSATLMVNGASVKHLLNLK
ncbi:MAG: hypothetical protein JSU01_15260 [Bacteroidetes bacterium]|nr:hypothetical protein [Bacteroidota bacterium]